MISKPEWITDCSTEECVDYHHNYQEHVMLDFKTHLNLKKENFEQIDAYDESAALRIACFVHWMIDNVDLNNIVLPLVLSNYFD